MQMKKGHNLTFNGQKLVAEEEFEIALYLLRNWVCGNGDLQFVSRAQYDELVHKSGEFLKRYPMEKTDDPA